MKGKETKLRREMYNFLFYLYITGTFVSPWITFVQQILDECDFSYIWLEQRCDNVKLAVEQLSLKDLFLQKWHCELLSMSSPDLYCQLKDEFKFEKYQPCENRKFAGYL